jgi:hypothetical protein
MRKFNPLPPLERLKELLIVVPIPPNRIGEWSGLIKRVSKGGKLAGTVAGNRKPNPRREGRFDWWVKVDGKLYAASRIIYYMVYETAPGNFEVDHEDRNSENNNAWNLRLDKDRSIQWVNIPVKKNNTSGVTGVSWCEDSCKWRVRLTLGYDVKYLGRYACKLEASRVIKEALMTLGWDKKGRILPDLDLITCSCNRCSTII